MPREHHRDLPIGIYVLIGSLVVGKELFGVSTTIHIGLGLAGVLLAISLATAALAQVPPVASRDQAGAPAGAEPKRPAQMGGASELTSR